MNIMNKCLAVFLLSAVLAVATDAKAAVQNPIIDVGDANALVDQLIATLKKMIIEKKVEPIHLPNIHEDKEVGPMSFGVDLDSGRLNGLTTIYRAGNSAITFKGGAKYNLDVQLGLKVIIAAYHISAHALFIHTGGSVTADADRVNIHFVADVCLDGSCPTDITTLYISHVDYHPHIHVLPGFNWLASLIGDLVINNAFKANINGLIQNELKPVIKQAIDNFVHPK